MNDSSERAIAIVGLGAILPDAPNVAAFWQNILNKRYSINEVPANRWSASGDSLADYYDPDPKTPDKTYSKIGGWVRGFEFDWKRFRMPPKVAAAMDQGQQWALTIAADALADYGYPERPLDTDRTAVVLGTAMGGELHYLTNLRINFPEFANALKNVTEFAQLPADLRRTILERWHETIDQQIPSISEDSMPGELPNVVSGRVANVLNLRGPNFITDAACASSFAAVDAAVELLTEHKVDAVVTGGVDRNMGIGSFVKFCKIGALSATGTRPFGDGADGFVMGEGAGAFLLKRLEDAERAGDKIYAVIRGVGGASDGKGKGITAPNPIGQQLAMQRAWEQAGLDPATATLVEAHGTSTRVGDVVEVESLSKIFGAAKPGSIGLGSVKSNIGHLKAGAGAAGLLKAALALHYKILPPTLNSEKPNPNIDFAHSPFSLVHQPREWQPNNGTPRRCGVSAYGFGGTNFHLVLEEYVPGMLKARQYAVSSGQYSVEEGREKREEGRERRGERGDSLLSSRSSLLAPHSSPLVSQPVRGILAIGAKTAQALKEQLDGVVQRVDGGWTPQVALPNTAVLTSPERLIIDFGNHEELLDKVHKAQKAAGFDNPQAWKALQAQGIFRGSGPKPGKVAFLFPGQGSQYVNMGKELTKLSPIVAEVFAEADRVMIPILGKPLTDYIFVEPENVAMAEMELMQTAVTQPAMLTLDTAIYKLLASYGFAPDMVMGHSLGEYAALIAADIMPFADALEAAAARGSEMSKVSVGDNGKMAAVLAPIDVVEQTLKELGGYVVPANINSYGQAVIGGASKDVERAVEVFTEKGFRAIPLPVSHAFHTNIVAPASAPLRQVLNRLHIAPPKLQMVANVTGDFYPQTVEEIKDMLQQQIASPVQWVKGLETLYAAGVRTFVEVGPKKALKGFVDDVLGKKADIISLFTNHPKTGELASFNQAMCGLYAAGYGGEYAVLSTQYSVKSEQKTVSSGQVERNEDMKPGNGFAPVGTPELGQLFTQLLNYQLPNHRPYDRNEPPLGSVVMTGAGLGLPGAEKAVMDPDNAMRILRGEQFVDLIPERFRKRILAKRVTRLVKSEDGNGRFETITDPDEVIKLAGRPGYFDLTAEYGVPAKLVEALDMTTQLAMAAGLDALREAGIPLVQTFRRTSTGKFLPDRWLLPEALRDETGVIFASAFPGGDRFADEFGRYYTYQNRLDQLNMLQDFRCYCNDGDTLREIDRRIADLRDTLAREPYEFDRRFLFRILSMGHSQFAEYIGARGPNTQVNAACASTAQGIAIAEDWIRSGRCRRVVVIGADNVTGDHLMEWVGAGFLATGAAATDDRVEEAALPFDRRRHGTIIGMGACALVLESEDAVRERGMRGIVELLSSETNNSAFHGTRLDVTHISQVMDNLLKTAEYRFGLDRRTMAGQMVFMSHETFTPARGGSASAEVYALRSTFGEAASEIVMANTKGFTGHPMGVGVEDVIALKILEYGIVPPVPNFKEVDPDLGRLNLSRGGRYPVQYALHLAAGFGSQIAMTLTRRIPGALDRVENKPMYQRWLDDVSGHDRAELEVEKRVLRVKSAGTPGRSPVASSWRYGTGPVVRTGGNQYPVVSNQWAVNSQQSTVNSQQSTVNSERSAISSQQSAISSQPAEKGEERGVRSEERETKAESPISNLQSPVTQLPNSPLTQLPAADDIQTKVMQIVAAQTGYPVDMLDPELDMEADLGIDTVKQAETFAAIRKAFDIPRRDDLKLRDYPTLKRVVEFVKENSTQLSVSSEQLSVNGGQPTANLQSPIPNPQSASDGVLAKVLEIVAAQTGYPVEMLEPDLDMEADLGIDTVKQAETFAAIRKAFDIPRRDDLKLRDYPTLKRVVEFVKENSTQLSVSSEQLSVNGGQPTANLQSPISNPQSPSDGVLAKVLEIVAAQTGYPVEMLEPDLDMEADLGIDTVKQAETFAAIRKAFDIPRRDDLKLRDYPTLKRVVEFVKEAGKGEGGKAKSEERRENEAPLAPHSSLLAPQSSGWSLITSNAVPRRVPTPALRPFLSLCKPTGVTLNKQSRVIIMPDKGGVGQVLNAQLQALGVTTLMLEETPMSDMLELEIRNWAMSGFIQGVYWLPALDEEPTLEEMNLAQWQEANRLRLKDLYFVMRTLYGVMTLPNNFLVSATRLGGLHGYGPGGATAPLGGAVTGFTKAFKRERPNPLVKAVDFGATDPDSLAKTLIAETLSDPGVVEVGYWENGRYSITLTEQPIDLESGRINSQQPGTGSSLQSQPALAEGESAQADLATVSAVSTAILNKETVFLVTGAAGGITSAIVEDLAAASGGVFYLLDLVAAPDPKDEHIVLFRQDKKGLKQRLIEETKAAGEKPTPVVIDKKIMAVERAEAALRAIETVQAAGGTAHYYSADLRNETAVSAIINDICQKNGRIDVLIHAAGLEISRSLADKDPDQFNLVFDVKADGFFNLLRAAKGMPIGATVAFSSVAGRFGNNGQTDYSAANDLLCKLTSSLKRWRPEIRGIVIDWTAWGQIGMATRGSIPKIMEMAGIDMLQPEVGVPTVRRELLYSPGQEIVVAGKLGVMVQEFDETGGLDVSSRSVLAAQTPPFVMVGQMKAAKLYGGMEVETTLDPNEQPFLYDHAMDGVPLLPGVMGTETFAQLATVLAPGYAVTAVENEQFHRAFKFFKMQPQTLYLTMTVQPVDNGELLAHGELRSRLVKPDQTVQEKLHFSADVRLNRTQINADGRRLEGFVPPTVWPIDPQAIYKVYFHGPAYQVMAGAVVDGETAVGQMTLNLPPNIHPAEAASIMAPRLIELCFQTAGVWEIKSKGVMALPAFVGQVSAYRQPEPNKQYYALVQAVNSGESFNAQVVDETGVVYVDLVNYRTVQLPGSVQL